MGDIAQNAVKASQNATDLSCDKLTPAVENGTGYKDGNIGEGKIAAAAGAGQELLLLSK